MARLSARGYFIQPRSGLPALDQVKRDANNVLAFVEDCCLLGEQHRIDADILRHCYAVHCETHGTKAFGDSLFGQRIQDAAQA